MFELKGKNVVFFGAVGYLATPIIWKMAELGANLFLADFNDERAASVAAEMSGKFPDQRFASCHLDSGDYAEIDARFEEIKEFFGSLDVMVSGVSGAHNLTVEEFEPEKINAAFARHVTGSFLLARKSAELMANGGSVILFSSMYGQVSPDPSVYRPPMKPNPIDYGMCKAALNQMIRYLGIYWAKRGIRVNGVAPGPFPNQDKYTDDDCDFIERLEAKVPMGRVGKREEMAGSVIFLASDESAFTNGQILNVDGGWTAW